MCVSGGCGGKEGGLMSRPIDFSVTGTWWLVATVFSEEEERVSVGMRVCLGQVP